MRQKEEIGKERIKVAKCIKNVSKELYQTYQKVSKTCQYRTEVLTSWVSPATVLDPSLGEFF